MHEARAYDARGSSDPSLACLAVLLRASASAVPALNARMQNGRLNPCSRRQGGKLFADSHASGISERVDSPLAEPADYFGFFAICQAEESFLGVPS